MIVFVLLLVVSESWISKLWWWLFTCYFFFNLMFVKINGLCFKTKKGWRGNQSVMIISQNNKCHHQHDNVWKSMIAIYFGKTYKYTAYHTAATRDKRKTLPISSQNPKSFQINHTNNLKNTNTKTTNKHPYYHEIYYFIHHYDFLIVVVDDVCLFIHGRW